MLSLIVFAIAPACICSSFQSPQELSEKPLPTVSARSSDIIARCHVRSCLIENKITFKTVSLNGFDSFVCFNISESDIAKLMNSLAPPKDYDLLIGQLRKLHPIGDTSQRDVNVTLGKSKVAGISSAMWSDVRSYLVSQHLAAETDYVRSVSWKSYRFKRSPKVYDRGYKLSVHLKDKDLALQYLISTKSCYIIK